MAIRSDERLLVELWARQQSAAGRAKLREWISLEHGLAHVGQW